MPEPLRLPSNTLQLPYSPTDYQDVNQGQWRQEAEVKKERARASWRGPFWPTDFEHSSIVLTGADTIHYAQASLNSIVSTALDRIEDAVFWVDPEVTPQNDPHKFPDLARLDDEICEMIDRQFNNQIHQNIFKTMRAALRTRRVCGYSVTEKWWDAIDGEWQVQLKNCKPWEFTPIIDEYYNLIQLHHYPTGQRFNPAAFIWSVWPYIQDRSWYGNSVIAPIYPEILKLERLQFARSKNNHLTAVAPVLHYFDAEARGLPMAQQVNQNVDQMESATILHLPANFDRIKGELQKYDAFEKMDNRLSEASQRDIQNEIDELKKTISRKIGVPDDMGDQETPTGSRAKAQVQYTGPFMAAVNTCIDDIEDWGNGIIAEMIRRNYPSLPGNYKIPKLQVPESEEEGMQQKMQFYQFGVQAGIFDPITDAAWMRERLGVPPRDEHAEVETHLPGSPAPAK
jgi:hypothetical protein